MFKVSTLLFGLAAAAPAVAAAFHVPHSAAIAIAAAPGPGGTMELVCITAARVDDFLPMRSMDEGVTWEVISGEGVELAKGSDVVYHSRIPSDAGSGMFLIGTDRGVWAYHPGGGRVETWSGGIAPEDLSVVDMAVPAKGSEGPAIFISTTGVVYTRYPGDPAWSLSVDFGITSLPFKATVTVVPHFNPAAGPGFDRALLASVNGHLKYSRDGGATWGVHPQFRTNPGTGNTLLISGVAFAEDFRTSGTIVLGRGRIDVGYGELMLSTEFGRNFNVVHVLDTNVSGVAASPPGPDGKRCFLAAGERYPWDGSFQSGIFRSDDYGATWSDFGNAQDFLLRENAGNPNSQLDGLLLKHLLVFSPTYRFDGSVYHNRQQGLWKSEDRGVHWGWRRVRPESDYRDLEVTKDAGGNPLLFAATYGSGTIKHDLGLGTCELLILGSTMAYQKALMASPVFSEDGTVIVGGALDIQAWYDPALGATNPYGATGWVDLPVFNPLQGTDEGYPRTVALSTKFDGRTGPGTDPTIVWNVLERPPYRSEDGGQTAELLRRIAGTPDFMEIMPDIEIAPTYDGNDPLLKKDMYGIRWDGKLYRLKDDLWILIHDFQTPGVAVKVDPHYSRPDNPRVFVVLREGPSVAEVIDQPSGVTTVTDLSAGIEDALVTDLAFAEDFDVNPVLYASTLGSGAYRMDLSAPAPTWLPVGSGFPPYWAKSVRASPNHAADKTIYVGTSRGLVSLVDSGGASAWQNQPLTFFRDNERAAVEFYAPNDPSNPQPDRIWNWTSEPAASLPAPLVGRGPDMVSTTHDGSSIVMHENASTVRFLTAAGPGMGRVSVILFDPGSGKVVQYQGVDLAVASAQFQPFTVEVSVPATRTLEVRVDTYVDPGEKVYFDGFEVVR